MYLIKYLSIILYYYALIHLARLIDNPDSFADDLMTSIFRLKFNTTSSQVRFSLALEVGREKAT